MNTIRLNPPTRSAAVRGGTGSSAPMATSALADQHLRAWMHEGLQDLPRGSSVLAIGCDEAFRAAQLAEYAAEVTVLDTSGGQMGQLGRRFPDITFLQHTPSRPLPFAMETFDAIWCCEFLDRVFDPAAALREMHRVLVPAGRLLVTVPDHGTVRRVLRTLFTREEATAVNPRIRHFTRSQLVTLTQRAGFDAVHTSTGGGLLRRASGNAPRQLLLRAQKAAAAGLIAAGPEAGAAAVEVDLMDDLAFAHRRRAA